MLPVTPKTLFFVLLLYDNTFVSHAGRWANCPATLMNSSQVSTFGDKCLFLTSVPLDLPYQSGRDRCWGSDDGITPIARPVELRTQSMYNHSRDWVKSIGIEPWVGFGWWSFTQQYVFDTDKSPATYTLEWGPGSPAFGENGLCVYIKNYGSGQWFLSEDICFESRRLSLCQVDNSEYLDCENPNPCENGGICEELPGKGTFKCDCPAGVKGTICSEDVDECASNPCGKGICDQSLGRNNYICSNCSDRRVGKNCEFTLPVAPEHNCAIYVMEYEDLSCTCDTSNIGIPPGKVGWKLKEGEYTRTLHRATIRRRDAGLNYTCELFWAPGNDISSVRTERKYYPAIAYGPSDMDTSIIGNSRIKVTDDPTPVCLSCYSSETIPDPHTLWDGVVCQGGNYASKCCVTPVVGKITVRCTLQNPINTSFEGRASVNWTFEATNSGHIVIKLLSIGEVAQPHVRVSTTSTRMELLCEVAGYPLPSVDVFHSPGVSDEDKQVPFTVKLSPTRISANSKAYLITSPDSCQSQDRYKCEAKRNNQTVSSVIALSVNCRTPQQSQLAAIIAGVSVPFALLSLCAACLLWRRRRKAKAHAEVYGTCRPNSEMKMEEEDTDVFRDGNPSASTATAEGGMSTSASFEAGITDDVGSISKSGESS